MPGSGLVGPLAVFECPLEGSTENPACNGTQLGEATLFFALHLLLSLFVAPH
jgi:hypothetical protein